MVIGIIPRFHTVTNKFNKLNNIITFIINAIVNYERNATSEIKNLNPINISTVQGLRLYKYRMQAFFEPVTAKTSEGIHAETNNGQKLETDIPQLIT